MGRTASLIALLAASLLSGCAVDPAARLAREESRELPFSTPAGEANYHVLMAELALQRELFPTAASEYAKAARLTGDVELAARAARVAYQLGEDKPALESARRWLDLDPSSSEARRLLVSLQLQRGASQAAHEHLVWLMEHTATSTAEAFAAVTALLMLEQNTKAALEAISRLAASYPDVAEGQYALATMALRAQDTERARAAARRASELAPDWPQAGMLHARTLMVLGETDSGLAQAERIASAHSDPSIGLEYAVLLAMMGRDDEADAELDKVLTQEPNLPGALRTAGLLALRQGELDEAERHFTALLASGSQTLDAFYFLARVADDRAQRMRAMRLYMRVRAGDYSVAAQVRTAQILHELGRSEEALIHLERFGDANPRYAVEMISARGNLLRVMGDPQGALDLYNAALLTRPDTESLLYARAFLYEEMDRIDEAIQELRGLVRRNPADPTALNALGYTLADRTTRYREAHRYIRKALALEPDNPAIIDSMGWVEYRLGRYDRALEHLQRAYSLVQDSEIAAHLGEVLWVTGDAKGARDVLEEALSRDPSSELLDQVMQRFSD